jgi:hypothetical protein
MKTPVFDFASFVVVANGSVDMTATVEKFQAQLETYVSSQVGVNETMDQAVKDLFEAHPRTLSMPFVINAILASLEMTPENCKELTKRAQDFIRQNSSKVRDGSLLRVEVGRGGGVSLWSNVPEEETKTG